MERDNSKGYWELTASPGSDILRLSSGQRCKIAAMPLDDYIESDWVDAVEIIVEEV